MDAKTHLHQLSLLEHCPCGALILDDAGTIRWVNPRLEKMLDMQTGQLIDQAANALPFAAHPDFGQSDGIVQTTHAEARWLQWSRSRPEDSDGDRASLIFFQDITETLRLSQENKRLRELVDELTITDELTGLANARALGQALSAQVTRTRRYHNPLSIIIVQLSCGSSADEPPPDEVILSTSHYLRNRLRWADIIGRWDHNKFLIILPETGEEDGTRLLQEIEEGFYQTALPEACADTAYQLQFGFANWEKGDDPKRLLNRAQQALLKGSDPSPNASA